jgi:hypothetical protein
LKALQRVKKKLAGAPPTGSTDPAPTVPAGPLPRGLLSAPRPRPVEEADERAALHLIALVRDLSEARAPSYGAEPHRHLIAEGSRLFGESAAGGPIYLRGGFSCGVLHPAGGGAPVLARARAHLLDVVGTIPCGNYGSLGCSAPHTVCLVSQSIAGASGVVIVTLCPHRVILSVPEGAWQHGRGSMR